MGRLVACFWVVALLLTSAAASAQESNTESAEDIDGSSSEQASSDLLDGWMDDFPDEGEAVEAAEAGEPEGEADGKTPLPFYSIGEYEVTAYVAQNDPGYLSSMVTIEGQWINEASLFSLSDIYRYLANVQAPIFTDGGFVIRGINTESPDVENITGAQYPLATIYADGVALNQQSMRRGPLGLWDVDRVEVLRGPQGTRSARSALAGAIYIDTNDPSFQNEGAIRAVFGTYETYEVDGMINAPINDEFAVRLAVSASTQDSFIDYPTWQGLPEFNNFSSTQSLLARTKLLYQPEANPDFSALATFVVSYGSPALGDVFGPNAPTPAGVPPASSFFDRLWLADSAAANVFQVRGLWTGVGSLELNWEVNDEIFLKSLTSWVGSSLDITNLNSDFVRRDTEQEYAQELKTDFSYESIEGVAGIYLAYAIEDSTQLDLERKLDNYALFADGDFEVIEDVYVIFGGRVEYFGMSTNFTPIGASQVRNTNSEIVFLPRVGARWEYLEGQSIGVTYSRGYQPGGVLIDTNTNIISEFNSSSAWTSELSLRNRFLDDKLLLSTNLFYTNWKDQQVPLDTFDLSTGFTSRIVNAGESRSWGVEVEAQAEITVGFAAFASVGYINSKYTDFIVNDVSPPPFPAQLNYNGYEYPQAPQVTATIGGRLELDHGFFVTADVEYNSNYYSPYLVAPAGTGIGLDVQVPQDEVIEVGDRTTVNLTIGWRYEDIEIIFFVRNLFDTNYLLSKTPGPITSVNPPAFEENFVASVGPPRVIGGSITLKF